MKLQSIKPSTSKGKKYTATFITNDSSGKKTKSISFGASGYRDFTLLNKKGGQFYKSEKSEREKVKDAYLTRHRKAENWNNPMSAGSLSRWILWNKPTLKGSITDFKRRFNL